MTEKYDLVIIGGGPGGLTAGIYASRSKLSTLVIEKGTPGGQAATTEEMENYPGFFGGTTGPQLMRRMHEHASHFGCRFVKEEVTTVDFAGVDKLVTTKKNQYVAKAVIVATGAEPRQLGLPGEGELKGKGVSYCATCDADFYEDLDVVVVGNGDAAIEEAIYLTRFAAKVSIIVIHDQGVLDATKVVQERAFKNPKLEFVWNSVLQSINGDGIVESVTVKNLKTGEAWDLESNGVFMFVGTLPRTGFLKGKILLDDQGYIPANELMETSTDGVYAVGDVRQKFLRQVVTAAADGAVAATVAEKYIHEEQYFQSEVIEQVKPAAVLFWSPMHQASLELVPAVEDFAAENRDKLQLVKIDTYRNQRISRRFEVTELPTIILFAGGQPVARLSGKINRDELATLLKHI